MITLVAPDGKELDVTRKSWGYYPMPSLNSRLRDQGFRTALTRNSAGKLFINVVDKDAVTDFEGYLAAEASTVVEWLDTRE